MSLKRMTDLLGKIALLAWPCLGLCQTCVPPTTKQQQDVTEYLAKYYHLAVLMPIKNEKANDACYWKFEFQNAQGKQVVAYLSPDRAFLTTELYDLRTDPLADERKRNESVTRMLTSGEPPSLGAADAPVTLVEFSDFECPYCQRLKTTLEQEVLPKEQGKVRIVFRNFPLPMHPWAKEAAMLAACAGLQDSANFWKVHDFIFNNQRDLTTDNLALKVTEFISTGTKVDKMEFHKCVDMDLTLGIVTRDIALGQQNGVRATPTAFVNGVRYEGVQSAAQLLAIIDSAVNGKAPPPFSQVVASTAVVTNQCIRPSPSTLK